MADMHEVQFTFQACEDLAAIWDSIAADAGAWHNATAANKSAADTFTVRLRHHVELLAANPEIGLERNDLLHGLRSSTMDRYSLYYRMRANHVEVLRLLVLPGGAVGAAG